MVPLKVWVPVPVLVRATVPEPFSITPAKLVEVLSPPVVSVAVVKAVEFVTRPVPPRAEAREPMVTLMPARSKVAPVDKVSAEPAPKALVLPAFKVPPLTVVAPVWRLVPDSVSVPEPTLVKPPVPPISPANAVLFESPAVSVLLPKVTVVPVTPANEPTVSLALSVKFAPDVPNTTAPVLATALPPDKASVPALTVVMPL